MLKTGVKQKIEKKNKRKHVDSVCCSSTVLIIRYKVNSAEQGNSHQHIHTNLGLTPTLTLI